MSLDVTQARLPGKTMPVRHLRSLPVGTIFKLHTANEAETWKVLPQDHVLFLSHPSQDIIPAGELLDRHPVGTLTVVTAGP